MGERLALKSQVGVIDDDCVERVERHSCALNHSDAGQEIDHPVMIISRRFCSDEIQHTATDALRLWQSRARPHFVQLGAPWVARERRNELALTGKYSAVGVAPNRSVI